MNSMWFRRLMPSMKSKLSHRSFTTKENPTEDLLRKKIMEMENDLKKRERIFAFFAYANLTISTIVFTAVYQPSVIKSIKNTLFLLKEIK